MVEIVREKTLLRKNAIFVEVLITLQKMFQKDQKRKGKAHAAGNSENRSTEHTPRKCFRCGSEDQLIEKNLKPPKENEKQQKQVRLLKKIIVHAKTNKITVTKIYIHLWNICLVMTNVLVEILVTVCNLPIEF